MVVWLTFIQDSMANGRDYVDLGLNCADVCKTLDQGLNGRQVNGLNESVLNAITQFNMLVGADVSAGSLTEVSLTELWPPSRRRLLSRGNEMSSLVSFTGMVINIRLRLGGRT